MTSQHGRRPLRHSIVPPYLLAELARRADTDLAARAHEALLLDDTHRRRRAALGVRVSPPSTRPDDGTGPRRTISDAHGTTTLPGQTVRTEGAQPVTDPAVDEAYDGLGATWSLFHDVYGRDSLDNAGLALDATVHYGQAYDNAFWDGARMVFGDGDGRVFTRFTVAVDVIGHELTHGVTEKTAALTYQGQSGALNESLSDVFGSLVKQRSLGQTATEADWLIGAGLFLPAIHGVALRSMKAPGTAYDDPLLGRDPQPATMAGYVHTTDDNGGVHTNSGIPNHAFYLAATSLAATAIAAHAWDGAGQVWYDVLTGGALPEDADFATFAKLTVQAASALLGAQAARAIQDAWSQVGVAAAGAGSDGTGPGAGSDGTGRGAGSDGTAGGTAPASDPAQRSSGPAGPASGPLLLRRTGGLAGLVLEREVELDSLPAHQAEQWRSLLGSGVLHALTACQPTPDGFVYEVRCPGAGLDVTTGERDLPSQARETIESTLRG